jgi:hypothetical protein
MAKIPDKPEQNVAGSPTSESPAEPAAQTQAEGQQRVQVEIDDSKALANYANLCRMMGTAEELIIDFGLNPQPFGIPTQPIVVNQRIIVNFFTAKRMLLALQEAVQRHEATFGVLEIDVRRRVRPGGGTIPARG